MKKFIAILISISLLETAAIGQGVIPSVPATASHPQNISSKAGAVLNYSNISSFNDAGSAFSVVLVQDLHCHPGVQKNINSILSQLYENYNVRNIFVEGAAGDLNTRWLSLIEDKKFADNAADVLLSDGKLTGSEYFAYKNDKQDILKGIEDAEIHLRNLERLASIVESRSDIEAILRDIEKDLRGAQNKNYSVFNKKLNRLYGQYKSGKIDSEKYYKKLLAYVRVSQKKEGIFSGIQIKMDEFADISNYLEINSSKNRINVKSVSSQISSVINELKNTITYNRYNQFAQKTDSFKNTDLLFEEFLEFDKENIIDLSKYKDLSLFIKNSNTSKYINPVKMIESERRLLKSLQLAGSLTKKEALIVLLSDLFENYKDYYGANLSSEGYAYLKSYGIKKYQNHFSENISYAHIGRLDKYYDLFSQYYETNVDRDKIFTKFIEEKIPDYGKKKTAARQKKNYLDILDDSEEVNIVVCGGFHSSGLEKELKEREISYIVITPKVEGDFRIAGTIYENILMNSVNPSNHAIALQVLSQTGESARFKSVIESMLSYELSKNTNLNIAQYLNDTVNTICAIDKVLLERSGVKNYRKPNNEGIEANNDGTFTLNVSFEGKEKIESVIINLSETKDYTASFFGRKYKDKAPFWEWVYLLPLSSFIFESNIFQKIVKKFFLKKVPASDIKKILKYNTAVKASDLLTSSFLIASILFFNPVFVPSLLAYVFMRSIIFALSHKEKKNAFEFLTGVGFVLAAPFTINLIDVSMHVPTIIIVAALGIVSNIALHTLYNRFTKKIVEIGSRRKFSKFSEQEIVEYVKKFNSTIQESVDLKKEAGEVGTYEFLTLLKIIEKKRLSVEATTEILKHLKEIISNFTEIEVNENFINKSINIFSKKIKWLSDNSENRIVKEILKLDEDFDSAADSIIYLLLQSFSNRANISYLKEDIADNDVNIQRRLYAYMLLKANGGELDSKTEKKLAGEAAVLLKDFNISRFVESRKNNKWLFNEEMKVYVSAVYLVLSSNYGNYITFDNEAEFYKDVLENTRMSPSYNNADNSLLFGKKYVINEKYNEDFLMTAAHEIGHKYLSSIGFDGLLPTKNAIHEFYADIASVLLNVKLGKDREALFNDIFKGLKFDEKIGEEHDTARSQLLLIKDLFAARGSRAADWLAFSDALNENVKSNISVRPITFSLFMKNVMAGYAAKRGIKTNMSFPVKKGFILTENLLKRMFSAGSISTASVLGNEYSKNAPFWEWVYMLPGVSFLTQNRFFSKFIADAAMKGKSEELKKAKLERLRSSRAIRLLDITGSAIFISSLLFGGGIFAVSVYFLTRAVIFSYAHKDYSWKESRSEKLKLSAVFLAFSLPAILVLTLGGFGISAIAASIVIGIPSNFILHGLYNKYKSKIPILRNFPKADVLEDFYNNLNAGNAVVNYSELSIPAAEYIKRHNIFSKGYDDRVNPANRQAVDELKERLSDRFGVLPDDIAVMSMNLLSSRDILNTVNVALYSFDEVDGRYLLRTDAHLIEFLREDQVFAEKFAELLEIDPVESGKTINTEIHKMTALEIKLYALRKRLQIPGLQTMKSYAQEMIDSEYNFSGINHILLDYISHVNLPSGFAHKKLIEFQIFELLGYILQSQTWLSPASINMQYGYFQKEVMNAERDSYERQLSNTDKFEMMFDKVFSNHNYSFLIKSKEAALFEYFKKRLVLSASFLIPETLSDKYKSFNITDISSNVYTFSGAENFRSFLGSALISGLIKYMVIDCSHEEDINEIADIIDEYNNRVPPKRKIKEVMFYNARPDHYGIEMIERSFKSEFIFDFASFMDNDKSERISKLFTKVPAVYVVNDTFVTDYGSRLDNFSLQYLYMLLFPESLSLNFTADAAHKSRLSIRPSDERISEGIRRLEYLKSEFEKLDFFDGIRKVAVIAALRDAEESIKILENEKSAPANLNFALDEYRTLLNYMLYFKWTDKKESVFGVSEKEKEDLAAVYNSTMRKITDSSGKEMSQDTILVTSGMSALSTIGAYLTSERAESIGMGQNIYYENMNMFQEASSFSYYNVFREVMYKEVSRLQSVGADAVFIDLVANSVHIPKGKTDDIVAADIKKIVNDLSTKKFSKPFFLCIDNSMYPYFQFADILDGIDFPDNFNIIIYGSMQKVHQRGLEINTAGFLTLISNGSNQEKTLAALKDAAVFTSSNLDDFRYVSMQEFLEKNNDLYDRTAKLNKNAEEVAGILNELSDLFGGEFKIIHTSLYPKGQKDVWENNLKPQIPFFFIRDRKERSTIKSFMYGLLINLEKERFFDFVQRDSYGFDFFTNISYGMDTLRFNVGDHSHEQKDKIIKALIKTFIQHASYVTGKEKVIDSLYSVFKNYNIEDGEMNEDIINGIFSFIDSKNTLKSLDRSELLKTAIIAGRLGREVPSQLQDAIEQIFKDKPADLSDKETALLTEAARYMPFMSSQEVLELSSSLWISGKPETEGAAAANLVEMLVPGKTYTPGTEKYAPDMLNNRSVSEMLRAA